MTHPTSGDEPSLSGQSEYSGREPMIGGSTGSGLTAALDGLTDRDWQVRVRSVKYLGDQRIGAAADRVVALLNDPNRQVRDATFNALVRFGGPAVPVLIDGLNGATGDYRRTATLIIREIGEPALPHILHALRTDDIRLIVYLMDLLGGVPHEASAAALIDGLAHGSLEVYQVASSVLLSHGQMALPYLMDALHHPNHRVRLTAVRVLGQYQYQPAIPHLITAVSDPEPLVQRAAIHALGGMGDEAPIDVLLQALRSPNYQMRISTANSMFRLPSFRTHRDQIVAALREIVEQDRAAPLSDEAAVELVHAISLLYDIEPEQTSPLLLAMIRDPLLVIGVRRRLVSYLEDNLEDELLTLIVQDTTLPDTLRDIAAHGLMNFGTPEALTAVARYRA